MEEVKITLAKAGDAESAGYINVCLNGNIYKLEVEKLIKVPKGIVEILENATIVIDRPEGKEIRPRFFFKVSK